MKGIFVLSALTFMVTSLLAQNTFSINSKENVQKALKEQKMYKYPTFSPGVAVFNDGSKAKALMNYNRLIDEVMFIEPKGDTLAINGQESIKYVVIGKDSIYYSNGYLQLVNGSISPKLLIKDVIVVSDKHKIGAYNIPNATTRVESYKKLGNGRPNDNITIDENTVFSRRHQFYFLDNSSKIYPATEKSIVKLFKGQESKVKKYLKENRPNLKEANEITAMINYISQ